VALRRYNVREAEQVVERNGASCLAAGPVCEPGLGTGGGDV